MMSRWPLFLLLGLLIFGTLGTPLLSHNEARRMVVAQEIIAQQNWLLPTMNGEIYITKPPLYTWLQALSAYWHPHDLWWLRLPSHISALLLLLLLYRWLRRHADEPSALWALLILGGAHLWIFHARLAEIEILLALLNTAALLWAYDFIRDQQKSRLRLAYASLGLAVMSKGPVALLFFFPPLLFYAYRHPAARAVFKDGWSWLILLSTALPWYLYVYVQVPPDMIQNIVHQDMAAKISGQGKPIYKYLEVLAGNFWPWLWLFFLPTSWRQNEQQRFLSIAILIPLLIFSLFSAKHGKYILPLLPLIAAWLALGLQTWLKQHLVWRQRLWYLGLAWLMALLIFHGLIAPRIWQHRYAHLQAIAAYLDSFDQPVFAWRQRPIQLLVYRDQPIPVVQQWPSQPALLLVDSRYWSEIADRPACLLAEWSPYIKKKRRLRLYRINAQRDCSGP